MVRTARQVETPTLMVPLRMVGFFRNSNRPMLRSLMSLQMFFFIRGRLLLELESLLFSPTKPSRQVLPQHLQKHSEMLVLPMLFFVRVRFLLALLPFPYDY